MNDLCRKHQFSSLNFLLVIHIIACFTVAMHDKAGI